MARKKGHVKLKKDNTISMIILGVVAVIAIVGLVLLFSAAKNAGLGIYGGQKAQYETRGTPHTIQIPGSSLTTTVYSVDSEATYIAKPNYGYDTTVYSNLKKCPKGALFSFKQFGEMEYNSAWNCPMDKVRGYYDEFGRAGVCCYLTESALI